MNMKSICPHRKSYCYFANDLYLYLQEKADLMNYTGSDDHSVQIFKIRACTSERLAGRCTRHRSDMISLFPRGTERTARWRGLLSTLQSIGLHVKGGGLFREHTANPNVSIGCHLCKVFPLLLPTQEDSGQHARLARQPSWFFTSP